jgi:2-C-methyl-D-erythritol 4-phosphate cytidylyltransferase/2-C-methyl-D-erythritol 2,4-cyclodiphosphate synthase
MSCTALIVAAGSGRRFGSAVPKQLLPLAGRPLLAWTVATMDRARAVDDMVLVVRGEDRRRVTRLLEELRPAKPYQLCDGGAERTVSVRCGLELLPPGCALVAVHDGARPLASATLVDRVVAAAEAAGAAVPALPVEDTLKRAQAGSVVQTVDRRDLWRVQTPQVFSADLLRRAYAGAWLEPATDDAQLVEQLGHPVRLVEGERMNIKITKPEDLETAAGMLEAANGPAARTGTGYDVHRLVPGRALVLGGVVIPSTEGLLGHSDADVLCHAVADALLGAAAIGDLGTYFPPGDPATRGASSLTLLAEVMQQVRQNGWEVGNIDATLIAERPRLAAYVAPMRANLAGCLGVELHRMSVKATTTEGLGPMGRGEGIAAQAVAVIAGTTTAAGLSKQ